MEAKTAKNDKAQSAACLCRQAATFLGAQLTPIAWLGGGEEARVLRVRGPGGDLVLHASPAWRSRDALTWCHRLALHAARSVPEVIAPLVRKQSSLFAWNGFHVAAFPYVAGKRLDRENHAHRSSAAGLLARIHRALLDWRDGPSPGGPALPNEREWPAGFDDCALDRWWRDTSLRGLTHSPTHGDFYRGNLLCKADRIVGVIDWLDACEQPLALELAGATFELCKRQDNSLDLERADDFIAAYRSADGPVAAEELRLLLPLMRLWIRRDAVLNHIHDSALNHDYVQGQARAFRALSSSAWVPAVVDS